MDSKKYMFLCVLYVIFIIDVKAQSVVEYVSSADSGQPNYTEHDLYSDGIRVENTSYIVFRLKSAGNAYVLLQQERNIYDDNAAEVKLGVTNNNNVSISTISSKPPWFSGWCPKPNIVSDQMYRTFWISWFKENIQVGTRNASHIDEVICSNRIHFNVRYISIGAANNTIGYWNFFKESLPTIEPWSSLSTVPLTSETTISKVYEKTSQKDAEVDNLTAVYVSVPVIITLAILMTVTTFLALRYRKQKIQKGKTVELDIVYSGNGSGRANVSVLPGLENPTYNEHISRNYENTISTNVEREESDSAQYAEIILETNEPKEACEINTAQMLDNEHHYDHSPHMEGKDHVDLSEDDLPVEAYSHINAVDIAENAALSTLDVIDETTDKMDDTQITSGIEQNLTTVDDPTEPSTFYDHAIAGKDNQSHGDSNEYSHPGDLKDG